MCRYAMYGPYKEKWACFECRKSFKQTSSYRLDGKIPLAEDGTRLVPCPQCGHQMHNMGLDFKAPARTDKVQWKKVEILFQNGFNFSSCGCGGPGPRPARLNEVSVFLAEINEVVAEGERRARRSKRVPRLEAIRQGQRERQEAKRVKTTLKAAA